MRGSVIPDIFAMVVLVCSIFYGLFDVSCPLACFCLVLLARDLTARQTAIMLRTRMAPIP